ncbi:hypothetical protein COY07_00800 [Candidatus Peregrinibacteria bacterium CG_4_10_14_0_2_um_filter_43_11]|nr:MAG: hypothetical protein COY07_00800 [Candidatus Peregrinibacteria bacterium CG_4_10_14_0_2_um_filter_43_11]
MRILNPKIISLFLLPIIAFTAVPNTHAIFSPVLSDQIETIKSHATAAREQNGVGTGTQAAKKVFDDKTVEKLKQDDKENREQNEPTGLPGAYTQLLGESKITDAKEALASYGESLLLIFNILPGKGPITSCLRDDIFEVEKLRDTVRREALRSGLLKNSENATLLWGDYQILRAILKLMKTKFEDTKLLFDEGKNYYIDCPYGGFAGEFEAAFKDLENSWDRFASAASGSNAQWGNIWAMAKSRARVRAAEWIKANLLALGLGGQKGGNTNSLMKGQGGIDGVAAEFETQWGILKALIGPITPLFDPALYKGEGATGKVSCVYYMADENNWFPCNEEQSVAFKKGKCEQCRSKLSTKNPAQIAQEIQDSIQHKNIQLSEAETTLTFSLRFNNLSKNSTEALAQKLFAINGEIKRATQAPQSKGDVDVSMTCEEWSIIFAEHCANKGGSAAVPVCK